MKRILTLLVGFVLAFALATEYPLRATDALGRTVTLEAEPQRIVVMLPSATETLCAIGACDKIVATDSFSNWPEEVQDKPKAGGLYDPNIELIASLKPDLVITSRFGKLTETLEQIGITAYAVNTETFEDIFKTARELGQLVNREAQAEALIARIQRDVFALESVAAKAGAKPTVYYEIDATPYTVGPGSFIHTLIEKAGGENIIPAELGLFPKISPELVVAKDPEVIVLGDAPFGVTRASLAERPGWAELKALRNGRVCELTRDQTDLIHRPGPRVAEGLKVLIGCLHPDLDLE
ncbi:ABC transporter substrate-binding protein [Marinithermus hydrothermalis]|uniref:ABC-type transporter, periplasmic subunit n=1 Tax=Marinithermus hydrothermalis (strain DSM 14884 / JCM 11576 / T1) TaxID=869210 RepID=F2NMZ0_MARHT|nr:ABC transporter substrate-binding protein [Marinithermus hydrothermalis]AEB12729.1 ABC-type transporter, periplasmic subunit [Marinithermus hydrothermalis DSM 14884]